MILFFISFEQHATWDFEIWASRFLYCWCLYGTSTKLSPVLSFLFFLHPPGQRNVRSFAVPVNTWRGVQSLLFSFKTRANKTSLTTLLNSETRSETFLFPWEELGNKPHRVSYE
jgi:hypothetical protein